MSLTAITAREAKHLISTGELNLAEFVASQRASNRSRGIKNGQLVAGRTVSSAKAAAPPASSTARAQAAAAPPAPKLSRAETVALAVRTDPSLKGAEDIALFMLDEDPELKSVGGDGIVKLMRGVDRKAYRASMAGQQRAKRQAEIDAMWERAVVAVFGGVRPAPQGIGCHAASSAKIWNRAIAKVFPANGRHSSGSIREGRQSVGHPVWDNVLGERRSLS
ncbi:hypothetical protein [Sphingopyxis flava]|uniref:Uncharacterized protein n=1 Tax=Sphingopyxis flava TaxID=1507287 RepID=A0A1T5END4_9SPHN|nr:hypothetical protein [Sphingopyxis flava]SKB85329.1 hypothetical protein SAMN06295937_102347 [Sphingopyxis flava]